MKIALIVVVILAAIVIGWVLFKKSPPAVYPTPTISATSSPSSSPAITNQPDITIESPTSGATIGNPVTIKGQARVFESTVAYRIEDANGKVLASGNTIAKAPDVGQFGPYEVSVSYPIPATANGTVEVYWLSPKDGSELGNVVVPVVFLNHQ